LVPTYQHNLVVAARLLFHPAYACNIARGVE